MDDADPITDGSDVSDANSQFGDDDSTDVPTLDMSTIFSAVSLPTSTTTLPSISGAESSKSCVGPKDLSHAALLRMALDDSGLSSRPTKDRRASGKQMVDAKRLRLLRDSPEQITLTNRCSKVQQTKAYNEYRKWYTRASGKTWKHAAPDALAGMRQGMYYVIGAKSTGMYRNTDCEPVKDLCFNMHTSPRTKFPC